MCMSMQLAVQCKLCCNLIDILPRHCSDVPDGIQDAKYDYTIFEPKENRSKNRTNDSSDETYQKSSKASAPTQRRGAYDLKQQRQCKSDAH